MVNIVDKLEQLIFPSARKEAGIDTKKKGDKIQKEAKKQSKEEDTNTTKDTTDSSVRKKVTGASKDDSTQRYLPFGEIRDNIIYMKDGSCRMVMRVETVNFSLKSEEEQDAIIISYQRFLNSLQFPVQIIVRSLKVDIDGYIKKLKTTANKQQNRLLKEQTERYIDFMTNLVELAQIMRKDFYIVVPHDEENGASVRSKGIFSFVKSFWESINQSENLDIIKSRRQKMESMNKKIHEKVHIIRNSLEQCGLKSTPLKKTELLDLMMSYYNPKTGNVTPIEAPLTEFDLADVA